jgi:hypothetical protein
MQKRKKVRGLGVQLSGRALAQHVPGLWFHPQHCKKEERKKKRPPAPLGLACLETATGPCSNEFPVPRRLSHVPLTHATKWGHCFLEK